MSPSLAEASRGRNLVPVAVRSRILSTSHAVSRLAGEFEVESPRSVLFDRDRQRRILAVAQRKRPALSRRVSERWKSEEGNAILTRNQAILVRQPVLAVLHFAARLTHARELRDELNRGFGKRLSVERHVPRDRLRRLSATAGAGNEQRPANQADQSPSRRSQSASHRLGLPGG